MGGLGDGLLSIRHGGEIANSATLQMTHRCMLFLLTILELGSAVLLAMVFIAVWINFENKLPVLCGVLLRLHSALNHHKILVLMLQTYNNILVENTNYSVHSQPTGVLLLNKAHSCLFCLCHSSYMQYSGDNSLIRT